MDAVNLRKIAQADSYERVVFKMNLAAFEGKQEENFEHLSSSVIERLLKEGFDVREEFDPRGFFKHFSVSCAEAAEGKSGSYTVVKPVAEGWETRDVLTSDEIENFLANGYDVTKECWHEGYDGHEHRCYHISYKKRENEERGHLKHQYLGNLGKDPYS